VKIPLLIIGSGLSGLAAAIRYARYSPDVLILEKHSRIGGLNSYYYRNKILIETGLHAITNYAKPKDKKAPLNQIFRQLKLNRKNLSLHEQNQSEIRFIDRESLIFSNDFSLLREQIQEKFPHCAEGFQNLIAAINAYSPYKPKPFLSTRAFVGRYISDPLLSEMLLCPLMYYGSSLENDMDLSQFIIIFRSIFMEGLFRPHGTIKEFLDMLFDHYKNFGGSIRTNSPVKRIIYKARRVYAVQLESGEIIHCDNILSTIGYEETLALLDRQVEKDTARRICFIESIFLLPISCRDNFSQTKTIIFYNKSETFRYERPREIIDLNSGVICFPSHFSGVEPRQYFEIRSTHLTDYQRWKSLENDKPAYIAEKHNLSRRSGNFIENIIGNFNENIVYEDTFTPLTIERFAGKKEGAIYGRPRKIKDGRIGFDNLFLAGTDQGYFGIIGSMLSGISMVNQHILPTL